MTNQLEGGEPQRPEGFGLDQNERVQQQARPDYPTEVPEVSPDLGFEENEEMEPIPVYQVAPPPSDLTTKRVAFNRVHVNDSRPANLAGNDDRRTRLYVKNNDATIDVFLLRDGTSPTWAGFQLDAGADVEMFHNDPVWAKCDSGEEADISIITEYVLVDE